MVLGQQKEDNKSNEITAIPKLLDLLDIKGATITLDVMGCQNKIAKQIISKGADYVLALKGNQGELSGEMKAYFHKADREGYVNLSAAQSEDIDCGHGRIEVRKCIQLEIDKDWLTQAQGWEGIQTVICIESERHI